MASCEMSDNYTVVIERVDTGGKLRFDVSNTKTPFDPNNNDANANEKLSTRHVASFELMEDGIRFIKVLPTSEQSFNVECTKSNGPLTEMSSVHVIHQRNRDMSLENVEFVTVPKVICKNVIPTICPNLSTFQSHKKNVVAATDHNSLTYSSSGNGGVVISEADLRAYSHFIFKFRPVLEPNFDNFEAPDIEEEANGNADDMNDLDDSSRYDEPISDIDTVEEFEYFKEGSDINFQAFFDIISITIELKNLFLQTMKPSSAPSAYSNIRQFGPTSDLYFRNQNSPDIRDLHAIARAQAIFQQQDATQSHTNQLRSPWHKSPNRAQIVRKFVKAIVKHRLQVLGVQHLDCNEIIDTWEAKQHNPFSFLFPDDNSFFSTDRTTNSGMFSLISKPNSDLFQLSPGGFITKSIFTTFVNQVDSIKGILNNATCNLVHTSVCLLLPEIKLLWGRQLDTNRNPVFIEEWMRLIVLAGTELKPVAPEEVIVMINRELKTLKSLSKELYHCTKKVFRKIQSLSKSSEDIFRKTLAQLNPKSLKKMDAFDNAMKKKYSPDVIHFDPDQLHKINIDPTDLFADHLFMSETPKGELLVKNDIDGLWRKFLELDFIDRRAIFLAMTEDFQTTLRACLHTIQHLQEIYTVGYPCSIKNLLKDMVNELKFTSNREDLSLLIKTSIVTHVSCLHEMLTRLLYISQEVKGVTKQFTQRLNRVSIDLKKLKRRQFKKSDKKSAEFSDTDTTTFNGFYRYDNFASGGFMNSNNAKLVIPFSSPCLDLAFKPNNV